MDPDDEQHPQVVRLEDVPVRTFLASQDHQQDLVRELQLVQIGNDYGLVTTRAPAELARLVGDILARYGGVRSATRAQAVAALERGEQTTAMDVPVAPGMAAALREWLDLLEAADRMCDAGYLLVTASSPEVRALRRWYVAELTRRLDGSA